jgi:hypothetical protein
MVDCDFVAMGPIHLGPLPYFVDCFLLYFLWLVSTCALLCLVFLVDGFPSLIFMYKFFFRINLDICLLCIIDYL